MDTKIKQDLIDGVIATAKKTVDIAFRFKEPRYIPIKQIEDAYQNRVRRSLKNRFNFPLPFISGFINTFQSKIDEFPTINFERTEESDLKAARKLTEMYKVESSVNRGNWAYADRVAKRMAMFSGRAIYNAYSYNDPKFNFCVDPIDYYDFGCEPTGGADLDKHLFMGRINIFKTETDIKNSMASGFYRTEGCNTLLKNGDDLTKKTFSILYEKNNRYKALGLNVETNDFVGTKVFNLVEWIVTYEGDKYYVLFDYDSNACLRLERLNDMFLKGLTPYVSWATDEDPSNFWSKGPAEDLYPVYEGMRILLNEGMDNMQKRGWNMKAYDQNIFTDPNLMMWRPDGNIPVDVPVGKSLQTAIYELKTEDNSASVERLVSFLDNLTGQKSSINSGTQGQASEDKVRIYLGNQQEAADRINFVSTMYREANAKIGLRFMYGVKQNLNEAYAVKMIGTDGVEWDKLRKEEINDFDITITGGTAEIQMLEIKKQKQAAALNSIASNPELISKINKNWFLEATLKQADFDESDIKNALDINNDGDQEILSEAAQAIEDILSGKTPSLNRGATTRYIQKIVDFASEEDIKPEVFDKLTAFAEAHIPIAQENSDKRARKLIEANAVNGIIPGQQPAQASPVIGPSDGAPAPEQAMPAIQ